MLAVLSLSTSTELAALVGLTALAALVRLLGKRTVSCEQSGLEAAGLADEDGRVRVVLLHGGVAALEEVAVRSSASIHPHSSCRAARIARSSLPRTSYRVAALCSLVWQNKNLSSFSPALNAYLEAIVSCVRRWRVQIVVVTVHWARLTFLSSPAPAY